MLDDNAPDLRIARRLKQIRLSRGLTLAQLAHKIDMSSAHLSRIETGERQPSIGALIQLARAHGISLSKLVGEDDELAYHVVRHGHGILHPSANGPYIALSGPFPGLQALHIDLAPSADAPPANHPGEEWLYVLDGSVCLVLDTETIHLETGDACHFNSGITHELRNQRDTSARVLLVSTATRSAHALPGPSPHTPHNES